MLWYLLRHSTPATIQNKMLQQASSGVKSSSYFDVRAFDTYTFRQVQPSTVTIRQSTVHGTENLTFSKEFRGCSV